MLRGIAGFLWPVVTNYHFSQDQSSRRAAGFMNRNFLPTRRRPAMNTFLWRHRLSTFHYAISLQGSKFSCCTQTSKCLSLIRQTPEHLHARAGGCRFASTSFQFLIALSLMGCYFSSGFLITTYHLSDSTFPHLTASLP